MRAGMTALFLAGLLSAGCATVGRDFDSTALGWMKAGETGKNELLEKLGQPFRVGVDSGDQTWTYGYYQYRLLGESNNKDLVIRFDAAGKAKSWTLNTTFRDEKEKLDPAVK